MCEFIVMPRRKHRNICSLISFINFIQNLPRKISAKIHSLQNFYDFLVTSEFLSLFIHCRISIIFHSLQSFYLFLFTAEFLSRSFTAEFLSFLSLFIHCRITITSVLSSALQHTQHYQLYNSCYLISLHAKQTCAVLLPMNSEIKQLFRRCCYHNRGEH